MISAFEQDVLSAPGNAQDKLRQFYGKPLSYSNAKKYFAGIKLHLETLQKLDTNKQTFEQEEVSFNKDKTQTVKRDVYLTADEAASPVKIMQKCGFDPLLWEVINCKLVSGSWDVTIKNNDGDGVQHTNRKYSVSLTVKPLGGKLNMDQVLQAFASLPPIKAVQHKYKQGTHMLELPMMDFHLGKLSWGDETGSADYDLQIAEELWKETITDLLGKASLYGAPEYILFPVGQDFFHFDTPSVTTTGGTQLDSDTRWQKMFLKGISLLGWAIEQCLAIAPVRVTWIPGNHDQTTSYYAVVGLYQRYANDPTVEVDLTPTPRKYIHYGQNLIGYTHGVEEGKRLEGLMQIEAPVAWGATTWREMHTGHLHTETTVTKNGIVFRRIASITAADSWHNEKGFIGSTRQAQAFVWDREKGLQAILNSNVIVKKETD